MRAAAAVALLIVAALLAAGPAGAASEVAFNAPGRWVAEGSSTAGAEWILLVFDGAPASFDLPVAAEAVVRNTTVSYPTVHDGSRSANPYSVVQESEGTVPSGSHVHLAMAGRSSLYVEAGRIALEAAGSVGTLAEKADAADLLAFARPQDARDRVHRMYQPAGDHAVLQVEAPGPTVPVGFRLTVEDARFVAWHGASVSCRQAEWCPEGGGASTGQPVHAGDVGAEVQSHSYISSSGIARLSGEGALAYAVLGGPSLSFSVADGSVRLPIATVAGCSGCAFSEGRTLTVSGDLELAGLRRTGESALAARLDGDAVRAQADEAAIDPALLGLNLAAGAAVAVGAAVLLKLMLGALFTKWHESDLLSQPRRRLVYETVVQNPGIGFRELTRRSGLAIGTVRHHLDVLLRHGKIVERPHGATLRFFEDHGRYDRDWARFTVLRDEGTRRVHGWLAEHPGVLQREVLDAMQAEGLSRTATQRRLQRLVDAGAVLMQQRGRTKVYRAA